MKFMRYTMALLAMGGIATACSVKTTDNDDDDNDGNGGNGGGTAAAGTGTGTGGTGTGTTATTGTTTGTGTSTTAGPSSSSTGGGGQTQICDSQLGLSDSPQDKTCAACWGQNCCDVTKACASDQNCLSCVTMMNQQAACDATMLDETMQGCVGTNCATECAHIIGG
jgi:hypothetical protein